MLLCQAPGMGCPGVVQYLESICSILPILDRATLVYSLFCCCRVVCLVRVRGSSILSVILVVVIWLFISKGKGKGKGVLDLVMSCPPVFLILFLRVALRSALCSFCSHSAPHD